MPKALFSFLVIWTAFSVYLPSSFSAEADESELTHSLNTSFESVDAFTESTRENALGNILKIAQSNPGVFTIGQRQKLHEVATRNTFSSWGIERTRSTEERRSAMDAIISIGDKVAIAVLFQSLKPTFFIGWERERFKKPLEDYGLEGEAANWVKTQESLLLDFSCLMHNPRMDDGVRRALRLAVADWADVFMTRVVFFLPDHGVGAVKKFLEHFGSGAKSNPQLALFVLANEALHAMNLAGLDYNTALLREMVVEFQKVKTKLSLGDHEKIISTLRELTQFTPNVPDDLYTQLMESEIKTVKEGRYSENVEASSLRSLSIYLANQRGNTDTCRDGFCSQADGNSPKNRKRFATISKLA